MSVSTAGLKCPVCGKWVSTDASRFGGPGAPASIIVGQELSVHLQTFHPDYLLWNRPYHLAWGVLFLAGFSLSLCGAFLKSFSFFPLAILVTLTPGIPLLIIYRRRFAEFKSHWAEEHPLASIQLTPAAIPSVNRCRICGEVIPVKKGLGWDLKEHYQSAHPAYYRWEYRRAPLVIVPLMFAGLTILVLGLSLEQSLPTIFGVAGFLLLVAAAMVYAFRGERRFKERVLS